MSDPSPSYWSLCRKEPYRIFFPLATLLGISGVSLWPLFFSGLHKFYPGPMHARMMIEGFMGGFVVGFLATAVPRLLSARPFRAVELWILVFLHLLANGLHIGHQMLAGDVAFVALLLFLAGCLVSRFRQRVELPPPSFALVGLGYLSGLAGTILWICGMRGWIAPEWMLIGNAWLNEAFVFLLVLGVGGFLLPRFLRIQGLPPMDEERTMSPKWRKRAGFSLLVGLIFLASYVVQFFGSGGQGPIMFRVAVTVLYILILVPLHLGRGWGGPVPQAVLIALAALVCGLALPIIGNIQRVAAMHLIFLGGFSLITFTVATRVVLGHSGHGRLFELPLISLRLITLLLLVGAVLRVWGDASPHRAIIFNTASYLWMAAAVVWSFAILPKVRKAGDEE